MKKLIIAFIALFVTTVSSSAMGYEQAREQALFLTDKMAYELNLTEEQYEAAYEVNLDYLMGVNGYDDVYGTYWTRRNLDLSYILLDWQYRLFVDATYFYRPLWWEGGYWHFGIYARYPHRDYFYFGRPHFYASYRGGHSWHMNGGRSWYNGRSFAGPDMHNGRPNGMRDGFQRGDYRNNGGNMNRGNGRNSFGNMGRPNGNVGRQTPQNGNQRQSMGQMQRQNMGQVQRQNTGTTMQPRQNNNSFGGATRSQSTRQSSTRTTVTRPQNSGSTFGNSARSNTQPRQSFTPSRSQSTSISRPSTSAPSRSSSSSFGGGSRGGSSFGGGSHSSGGSRSGGSFGGHR